MPVIAIANTAGSAGKTTTAVTLAVLLANAGRRTLLVDLDPQANATWACGLEPGDGTARVLRGYVAPDEAAEGCPDVAGLDVLTASGVLDAVELELDALRVGNLNRLAVHLDGSGDAYDVILIDCGGQAKTLTLNGLVAATHVVTVTYPSAKEARGVTELDELLGAVRQSTTNQVVGLVGVIPIAVPAPSVRRGIHTETLEWLAREHGARVTPSVRATSIAPAAYAHRRPLPLFRPSHGIVTDYRHVLSWLETTGGVTL